MHPIPVVSGRITLSNGFAPLSRDQIPAIPPFGGPHFPGTPGATPSMGRIVTGELIGSLIAAVPVWHRVPLTSRPVQPRDPRE